MATGQTNAPGRLWTSAPRVPRNTLLIASQGYRPPSPTKRPGLGNEQRTPTRERPVLIPVTAPAAARAYDAVSPSVPSTMPMASRPRVSAASQDSLDHEFTVGVMNLIQNQPLAPAIRQALREKVNIFAFTTNGQRATIDNLRGQIKTRDDVIKSREQEIHVLKHAAGKMRKKIESLGCRVKTQDESIIEWRERYEKDGERLVRRGRGLIQKKKTIAELEVRVTELEERVGEGEKKGDSGQAPIEVESDEGKSPIEVQDDPQKQRASQGEVEEMLEGSEKLEELPDDPPSARTRRSNARTKYITISDDDDDLEFEEPDDESDDDYVDD
ncbi:hypothetical protein B0T14DRAFT_559828 [Immersiella caudata]|uniref:Uncharacterized protein n=1 Tax=Immersiella caudata TaxID=314043 RepID=A0AA40CC95_9PEZI|nr:hypothetical protein B0T14DRAFT_559828 [Immersiella caudata]